MRTQLLRLAQFATISLVGVLSIDASADVHKFCYEPWPPYGEKLTDTTAKGSTVEFIAATMKALGHDVVFTESESPTRCKKLVTDGSYTGMVFDSPGGIVGGHDAPSIEFWLISAIVHDSNPARRFESMKQFAGQRAAFVKSYDYPENVADGLKRMRTIDLPGAERSLRLLDGRRVDVVFDDPVWAAQEIKSRHYKIRALTPPAAIMPTVVTFGPSRKDLWTAYRAKADELIKNGLLDSLYRKHLGMTFEQFKTRNSIP